MISDKLRARMNELCHIMEEVSGINPLEKTRMWDVVSARMMVCYRLVQEHFRGTDIARVFDLNHATMSHYKKRMTYITFPGWEGELETWNKFIAKIQEQEQLNGRA